MPSNTDMVVTLLKSIDTTLKRMAAATSRSPDAAIAPAKDLDGKYGDPEVKFVPRDWKGDNFKARKFSECPPELLDKVAEALDWVADKAEANEETTGNGKPRAPFVRQDAARARGWAQRKRNGWVPPTLAAPDPLLDSDDPEIDPFGGDEQPF